MTARSTSRAAARSVGEVWWRELLVLLGLTGFAISQPMLALLGDDPTVFTFHGVEGPLLVLLAIGLALLPPLVLWGLTLGITAIDRRAGWIAHLATVALLVGLTAVQVAKALGAGPVVALIASVLAALLLTWAYQRYAAVATWAQFTAVLPVAAVLLFLFASPTGDLLWSPAAGAADGPNDHPPVVVLVLDELPTLSLLDDEGRIDRVRFPNLAALADDATWYRRFSSVAPSTQYAVPAALTGNPPREVRPLWTNYPDNVFSLLAPTHDLVAFETATKLCGSDACHEGPPGAGQPARVRTLVATVADLFRERISPGGGRGARLDTFEEQIEIATSSAPAGEAPGDRFAQGLLTDRLPTRLHRVDDFLSWLEPPGERPTFYFLHLMLPHSPWRFAADGQLYDAAPLSGSYPFAPNNDRGDWLAAVTEQRHLLQAQYTDRVVGEVLDALEANDLYDDALVVLFADHGISFVPNTPARALDDRNLANLGELAYVPLLVKPPGQTEGTIDDTNVQSLDLLPTLADLLGIALPFEVEGAAVGSASIAERGDGKVFYDLVGGISNKSIRGIVEFHDDVELTARQRWVPPIERGDDPLIGLYRAFDLDRFLGEAFDDLVSDSGGRARIPMLERLRSTTDEFPLAVAEGEVLAPAGRGPGVVVAAIDDRVVAASPVHERRGAATFVLLFPPEVVGTGTLRVALVDDDGGTELELSP